jgi:hypothetical protein
MTTKAGKAFILKNSVLFEYKNIYNTLHQSTLMDNRLEKIRKSMKEKYDIDYLGVHVIDGTGKYFLRNMDHDLWHNFHWDSKLAVISPTLNKFTTLKSEENGVMFFKEFLDSKNIDIRASIVGELKQGVEIMFCNTFNDNKVLFSITFAKNKSIVSLDFKTYMCLIKDLKNNENCLDAFMNYFKLTGNIDDSPQMENLLNTKLKKTSSENNSY